MFDWNDEELANIIWGEAGESDDHIVPYSDASEEKTLVLFRGSKKREWNPDASIIKPSEQNESEAKTDFHGSNLEGTSEYEPNGLPTSGFGTEPWPDITLSDGTKTDSMGTGHSDSQAEITKFDSSKAETAQLDDGPELFQNQLEDREQGEFVDYGWSNVGSFDDLDRIFSNDDSIFGHVSLGNADALWSSSKDVTNISGGTPSLGLKTLRTASQPHELSSASMQHENHSYIPGYRKMKDPEVHGLDASLKQVECSGGKSKPIVEEKTALGTAGNPTIPNSLFSVGNVLSPKKLREKVIRQKKTSKSQNKPEEKSEGTYMQDFSITLPSTGSQFQQIDNQFSPSSLQMYPSSVLNQQMQNIPNSYIASSSYRHSTNQYPAVPVLSQIHSKEIMQQPMPSGFEVSKCNDLKYKSKDSQVKPLNMTPQEKIVKLRRRQQMQAMLAIQKQQQQFSHKISDHTGSQNCPQSFLHHVEGANVDFDDNLGNLPSFDPNSPMEQDDSNSISMAINDNTIGDTIFYQLQDIVDGLDMRIRICIRDSLFRLAQSAMQRQCTSDTSSINRSGRDDHEVIMAEEINRNRFTRMPDVETETNPIDRTVAHLLFHRPLELSGKHSETPESPLSAKQLQEGKVAGMVNLPVGCLPESSKSEKAFTCQRSQTHLPNLDNSDNASNNEPADGSEATKIEASHGRR